MHITHYNHNHRLLFNYCICYHLQCCHSHVMDIRYFSLSFHIFHFPFIFMQEYLVWCLTIFLFRVYLEFPYNYYSQSLHFAKWLHLLQSELLGLSPTIPDSVVTIVAVCQSTQEPCLIYLFIIFILNIFRKWWTSRYSVG